MVDEGMESLGDILKRSIPTRASTASTNTDDSWPSDVEKSMTPTCELCHGARFLGRDVPVDHPDFGQAFPCSCQNQEITREHRLRYAEFPDSDPPKTLQNFDLEGRSQAVRAARRFIDRQDPHYLLTLVGPNGTGKSHLVEAIGRAMLERDRWVKYVYVPDLLQKLRNTYDEDAKETFQWVFEHYGELPEVLLLDDLGAEEQHTPWVLGNLTRLVDFRYRNRKLTVIGTNLGAEEMGQQLSPRIADRIYDSGTKTAKAVRMEGQSWRTGINWLSILRRGR